MAVFFPLKTLFHLNLIRSSYVQSDAPVGPRPTCQAIKSLHSYFDVALVQTWLSVHK
jgi:hypothetical protein